jgi:hypothetical protein
MLSLAGKIQVCSHWLRGQLFPGSHLLIGKTVSSNWLAGFHGSSYWLAGRWVLDSMTETVNQLILIGTLIGRIHIHSWEGWLLCASRSCQNNVSSLVA